MIAGTEIIMKGIEILSDSANFDSCGKQILQLNKQYIYELKTRGSPTWLRPNVCHTRGPNSSVGKAL